MPRDEDDSLLDVAALLHERDSHVVHLVDQVPAARVRGEPSGEGDFGGGALGDGSARGVVAVLGGEGGAYGRCLGGRVMDASRTIAVPSAVRGSVQSICRSGTLIPLRDLSGPPIVIWQRT